jgi:hypothetical protein
VTRAELLAALIAERYAPTPRRPHGGHSATLRTSYGSAGPRCAVRRWVHRQPVACDAAVAPIVASHAGRHAATATAPDSSITRVETVEDIEWRCSPILEGVK